MAKGYTYSSTVILEAAFGIDLCPQNQLGLLLRACLMACASPEFCFVVVFSFDSWGVLLHSLFLVLVFLFISTQD